MDNKYFIYIFIGIIAVAILIYTMLTADKRKRFRLLMKIRSIYGTVPKREYSDEELHKIRTFFDTASAGNENIIDDITWNDLDLDSIFIAMNHTFSSVGEEVLYDMLREPLFSNEEREERERVIRFFMENDTVREKYQLEFAGMGRTKKFSLVQFLNQFKALKLKDDISHYGHIIAIPVAFSVIFISPAWGVLAVIAVIIYNVVTYYREKAAVEPYYVSLSAMCYLVRAALKLGKDKTPELSAYTEKIREEVSYVKSLEKNIKWLGGSNFSTMNILDIIMDYVRMVTHLDFVFFNHMVRSILNNEDHIIRLMREVGLLEAYISIGSYRNTVPFYCMGELTESRERSFSLKDGYHPLISEPVANSIHVDGPVLLTGSNASGKSTFLRMAALAALMAQTVNTVHAHEYKGSFYRIYSSMALRDDIQSGESYYIVEIKSLKRIMDKRKGEIPVLAFIDEVLRGTNTVERIAASTEILKVFEEEGVMVFAATHDIELTRLLEGRYRNYHFEEEVLNDTIRFNYELKEGRATTRNAIRLLHMMGYEDSVTKAAEEAASRFIEEGQWILAP